METYPLTITDKIRSYQAHYAALAKAMHPEMEAALVETAATRKPVYQIVHYRLEGCTFACGIIGKPLEAQCRIYKMLPHPKFFEVVTFDPVSKIYYLYDHHFFIRYAERFGVMNRTPSEILLHYVKHNPVMESDACKSRNHFLAVTRLGLIHAQREAANIITLSTVISNRTLSGRQLRETRGLRKRLKRKSEKMFTRMR